MRPAEVALGDIFEIARGGSPRPIDAFLTDDPAGVNWISISDASASSKYIRSTKRKIRREGISRSRMVKPGDFLLTNSMSFGRPYIVQTTGCIHDGWLVLSPKIGNVDRDYFYHLLGSPRVFSMFARLAAGATVKNLNIDLVASVKVELPALDEQRRIAAILDKADALRAKRREAIAKLDQLLQSVFLEMFGDPVTNTKGWPTTTVGELATFMTSGSRGWAQYYADSGARFIRIQNLVSGDLDLTDCAFVDAPTTAEAIRTRVQNGDVLVSITADLGRTAVVPKDIGHAHINQHIAMLRLSGIDPAFASHYLASRGGQIQFERLNRAGVKAGLNFNDLRSLTLPLPPSELQQQYGQMLTVLRAQKSAGIDHARSLDALSMSLQDQTFAEAR